MQLSAALCRCLDSLVAIVIPPFLVNTLLYQIRLQIRRTVSRSAKSSSGGGGDVATTGEVAFTDRDVADAKDGYVCCESYAEKKDFKHMSVMEKGIQVREPFD